MAIFDDLLTSYRGAGVIGTVMGVFVLGGFIFLSMFAFDPQYGGALQSVDSMLAAQSREITLLEAERSDAKQSYLKHLELKGRQSELEALLEKNEDKKAKLEKLARLRERVRIASAKIDAEVRDYVSSYRDQVRTAATGEVLPKIVVAGKLIENAVISQVTPAGIHVTYDEGIARVPANELPEELRTRFQFEESEMEAYLERERLRLGQMEESIDAGVEDKVKLERIKYLERRTTQVTHALNRAQANLKSLRRQRRPDANAVQSTNRLIKEAKAELGKLDRELTQLQKERTKPRGEVND
ncbi:hypothetical protein [Luteolibacter luteus]|uniref:Uncharacterized protein n=1 Tax=Luteolibacter luteus TaxID=2728835 RepID=A0A858RLW2_9BACT|nr:hypothetical protein [Luteolibacter luteus]QJE97715.1 hypothetical protein HHL09_18650 [Luteolibacter luteus]